MKPEKIQNKKSALHKVTLNSNKGKQVSKKSNVTKISEKNKLKVIDIVKRVKLNSSKGYFDFAKNLIVEWLSLDKFNRELNLELAIIYEKEKNYLNAEYIYKDLLEHLKVDFVVMKNLWFIYALQDKYKESLSIYEKIHKKKMADDDVIDILAELTFTMKLYKKTIKYANLYLVSKPRNVHKLFIKAKSLEKILQPEDALIVYNRILELQPYNKKAKNYIINIENELNIAKD